ncbi:hypothetical protein HYH03_014628 [Edaphochlamys debaryana]|uniref:allene-oxide cyclase n=1 Tax=Edaphochlamys debaryana TaxID=47281 RepID=A0A836BTC4_9CHLO|nr:hypothetical protein HYH03_014628 [Edaphochlamys debaryana]|eukprot:KAG2486699.1 hypothetical protein HYH03_014628 [Edaphochlamys debaryana]
MAIMARALPNAHSAAALFLMALSVVAAAMPPKDLCTRTLVVTEVYNDDGWSMPAHLREVSDNITNIIGYTTGYNDPAVWGGSGTSTRRVGTVLSTCFLQSVSPSGGQYNYCTATLTVGDYGSISWMGPFNDEEGDEFYNAITGGTGIYNGATGSVRTNVLKTAELWRYQFTFLEKPKC